jgi:predicted metalloendopeptidase
LTVPAILLVLALAACGRQAPIPAPAPAAAPTAGFDRSELDPAVRPQDDFWNHVNGKWLRATPIPPDLPNYGAFQMVAERTEGQLRELIEGAAAGKDAPGTDSRKIGDLYLSFMDEAGIEAAGLAPLQADMAAIAKLRSHEDVIAYFGRALATGVQVPVEFYVDAEARHPDRNMAYFWQGGLGLPDRDYYLGDTPELKATRDAYREHIGKLHALAGWPDGPGAATTILDLETRIARSHWTAVQNRNDEKIYSSQVTLAEAAAGSPGFDWPRFLASAGLAPGERFVVAQADYFRELGGIVRSVPVADWQTWLRFKTLKSYAPYLNAAIVAEDFHFQGGVLRGQEQNKPRWKRGVKLVSTELGDLVGKAYVAEHFPPASKARVDQMIQSLQQAFHQSIDQLEWMSPATKQAAQAKLARFRSKIGYPDRWKDYQSVAIRPDDLVGNLRNTRAFAFRYEAGKLGKAVDRDEWFMTPQTVNAYYQPTYNEIAFPAAILQPPFFDPAADDAYNYGSIGATIGHEFSHGFDDQGRKFDGDGRLRDWWTEADAARYNAEARRLVEQYNAFRPLPNFSVNGALTLGENIADLAGLVMAWRAWQASLGGKPSPVIDGFTGEQRFFIGYAASFRGQDRPAALQAQLLSDPHSPDEYRVTGVLRNLPEFQAAFGVKPGDKLYLPPEQQVRIW